MSARKHPNRMPAATLWWLPAFLSRYGLFTVYVQFLGCYISSLSSIQELNMSFCPVSGFLTVLTVQYLGYILCSSLPIIYLPPSRGEYMRLADTLRSIRKYCFRSFNLHQVAVSFDGYLTQHLLAYLIICGW